MKQYSFFIKDLNFVKGNEWWEYICPDLNTYTLIKILVGDFKEPPNWINYATNDRCFSYLVGGKVNLQRVVKLLSRLRVDKVKAHFW